MPPSTKGAVSLRVLLASLNAKYVHTNLAIRYLREETRTEFPDTLMLEFTINQSVAQIAAEIFEAKADVIGFSCYIWNLTRTLAVIRWLRPVCPEKRFVLGGPEVSYETEQLMRDNPEIDAVVMGEGEQAFPEILRACPISTGRMLSSFSTTSLDNPGILAKLQFSGILILSKAAWRSTSFC